MEWTGYWVRNQPSSRCRQNCVVQCSPSQSLSTQQQPWMEIERHSERERDVSRRSNGEQKQTIFALPKSNKRSMHFFLKISSMCCLRLMSPRKIAPVLFGIMAIIHRFRRYFVISSKYIFDIARAKQWLRKPHALHLFSIGSSVNRFYIFIDFSFSQSLALRTISPEFIP